LSLDTLQNIDKLRSSLPEAKDITEFLSSFPKKIRKLGLRPKFHLRTKSKSNPNPDYNPY